MKKIMLILTSLAALNCFAGEDIFTYKAGDYEVFTLVDTGFGGILDYVVKNNIPAAGMDLLYPAAGTVRPEGGGLSFEPAR